MKIRLRFFATFREIVGEKDLIIDAEEGSIVQDVISQLLKRYPNLEKQKESMIFSVNKEYAGLQTKLNDGDEIGILPPISGG